MNAASDPCAAFRDGLMDYVDGTLPPAARDAARAHELSCAACAGLARSVRAQAAILSRLRRPAPPPDLGARIERALGPRGTVLRPRRWLAWTAAAAAILVAAIALVASPTGPAPARSVQVVDVELPDRGTFLRRVSPNFENPSASLLDPLVANENP
jgi:anti-sigma factor RsiW